MPEGFRKPPSRKHVPKRRYGYNRLQSSVPGPSVGSAEGGMSTSGAGAGASGAGGGLSRGGKINFAEGGSTPKRKDYDVLKAPPQNALLGALSRLAKAVDEQALEPTQRALGRIPLGFRGGASEYTSGQREGLAGMLVPRLGNLGKVLEDASYGMPLTTGKGMTTGIKPEVGMAALEASQLPPVVKAGADVAKLLGKTAKEKLPSMASRLAEKYPLATSAATPMYAVKPQGGQWMPGSAKEFATDYGPIGAVSPHEEWAEKAIPKYIEKYMGAEGDPLADVRIPYGREMARWEDIADTLVHQSKREDIASPLSKSFIPTEKRRDLLADNPWLEKLPPETPLFEMEPSATGWPAAPLKDYIAHVLEHAQTIPPEKLKSYDFPRLVKEVQKVDAERAKKMSAARLASMEGMPVHKEYPEGYKWVQLTKPGEFVQESDVMGHSVRGYEPPKEHPEYTEASGKGGYEDYGAGGYEAIKSGKAKIYSLRGPKGESHATVEVTRGKPWNEKPGIFYNNPKLEWDWGQYYSEAKEKGEGLPDIKGFPEWLRKNNPKLFEEHADVFADAPYNINQIKGKQNLAPKAEYQPYVQDFVRSGKWSDIGDLEHTGLFDISKGANDALGYSINNQVGESGRKALQEKYGQYMSQQEFNDYLKSINKSPKMKKGGSVPCRDNCRCLQCLKRNFAGGGNVAPYLRKVSLNPEVESVLPAVSKVESSDNPKAIGPMTKYGRAMGQYQLLPTTAKDLDVDPMHPVQAQGGAHLYLSWLIGETGTLKDALAAYNMGLGNFKRRKGALPKETESYVNKVMALIAKSNAGTTPTLASAPVNPSDTTPQPDLELASLKTDSEGAESTTPMPDQIPSGPIGGGSSGRSIAFDKYKAVSNPAAGSVSVKNPIEEVQKILQNPMNLALLGGRD